MIDEDKTLLVTATQVAEMMVISKRTLWRLVEKKQFPQPIRYNRMLVRWRRADVEKYIAEEKVIGDKE